MGGEGLPMETSQVEVQGVLQADGTLVLDERPNLPAGRVTVLVRPLESAPPKRRPLVGFGVEIWAERKALGLQPRTAEAIDAEINVMRDEWEGHQLALERIQEEARRARTKPPC